MLFLTLQVRSDPHPECIQLDETGRIHLVIGTTIILKGGHMGVE